MHPDKNFEKIVNRTRYSVAASTLLAGDDFWDGHNYERRGRNIFLYRTKNGNYFKLTLSQWQGEDTDLIPLSQDQAIQLFEELREQRVNYEDAFPGVTIKEA